MKLKTALVSLVMLLLPTIFAIPAIAQVDISNDICTNGAGNGEKPAICKDIEDTGTKNVIYGKDGILTRTINFLSLAVGVIAVIVIIVAGIKMSLSQGEPSKIANSRNTIIYAIVGLVVAVVAQAVVQLVLNRIGDN